MSEKLLITWKQEYLDRDDTYSNHVTKFVDYLDIVVDKANEPKNISRQDIEGSIEHYNSKGLIKTRSSMENHLEAIKDFYKYLVSKHYTDDIFNNLASYQDYKDMIALKYNLPEYQSRGFREVGDMIRLVEQLDLYFESITYGNHKGINEKKRYIKFMILRIFIKLTLVAPAKKSVVCAIKRSDFNDDFRSVLINSVNIRIPNGLRRDIKEAIIFISKERNKEMLEDEVLFEFLYSPKKFRVEYLNEFFSLFLKRTEAIDIDTDSSSFQLEVIMNSALYCMVKNGANPALLSIISGVKISRLEEKFYDNGIVIDFAESLINDEISKTQYFNYI
ncbi:site-specific integrase [Paenibacillus agaridevorans]|uniref:site-specific integrase n=1 Tax=Paenibacillus agaridevorans TaxID=171404 RepID=UPI001BE40216|nr:site-specific integrase [Paenibacillus agaridevorans]